jgi:hypothetical protein
MTPTTISEEKVEGGVRFLLKNARPRRMRVAVMVAAPIALALIGITALNDFHDGHWVMGLVRIGFALIVLMAASFTLFGEESLDIAGGELWWRRGKNFERKANIGDVQQLEREGNQLRVIVREQAPIVIGSGLRQPPSAMEWLAEQVEAALIQSRR